MSDRWIQTTLGGIAARDGYGLVDGPFGSNLPASCYTDSGMPVIRGSNLSLGANRFRLDEFVFVSEETARRFERSVSRPGDIIFTKKGTLGQTGLVPKAGPYDRYLLSSNQMKLSVDRNIADPMFVYYYVSSPSSIEKIIRDSEATGVPKTNVAYLRTFPILLPPVREQRAIAHILGTLDDKIELNRRMGETLEAIARALFKSWFVDFDPVHAKAEGRDAGLPSHLDALFPNSFEPAELGMVPKGWSKGSILTQAKLLSGGTPKTERSDYWDGGIPWASAKDVSQAGQSFLIDTERTITQKGLRESATQLISKMSTVVVARGATTGRMVLIGREMAMNQTCYALTSSTQTPFTLYCTLLQSMDALASTAHGSVFDTITTSSFKASVVVLGPTPGPLAFDCLVSPLF